MAGDANAGGGGSVYWSVDVNKGDDTIIDCHKDSNGHHHQRGKDEDGRAGLDLFTVTIRIPQGQQPNVYLGNLRNAIQVTQDNGHVTFTVPIEDLGPTDDHKQINIKWGDQSGLPAHGNTMVNHPHAMAKHASPKKKAAPKKKIAPKKKVAAKNRKRAVRRGKRR